MGRREFIKSESHDGVPDTQQVRQEINTTIHSVPIKATGDQI
jgi:hypothetical protein